MLSLKHISGKLQRGFTLIELIIVIAVVGILSIALVPSWTGTSLGVVFEGRRVLNDIRYAQALSITTGQRYRWVKNSASSYSIVNESGSAILLPTGSTQATLTNNVTIGSLTNLPNNIVAFDSLGAPYVDTGLPGTPLGSTATILLNSGGGSVAIQITPGTGYGTIA